MLSNLNFFLQEMEKSLQEEYERRAHNLSSGCANTFDDYQRHVGFISGLRFALDTLLDVKDKTDEMITGN